MSSKNNGGSLLVLNTFLRVILVPIPNNPVVLFIVEGVQTLPLSHVDRDCDFLMESSRLAMTPLTSYYLSNGLFDPRRSVEESLQEKDE